MSHPSRLPEPQNQRTRPKGWTLGRIIDISEAKGQMLFALPMILTNMSYYAITLVSVMFAGHLGDTKLAGATIGNSWGTVTGLALMENGAFEAIWTRFEAWSKNRRWSTLFTGPQSTSQPPHLFLANSQPLMLFQGNAQSANSSNRRAISSTCGP